MPETENNTSPEPENVPKWLKSNFDSEEHRVWESIFPSNPDLPVRDGFTARRRRPGAFYLSKIIRFLAELGVYPILRTTATGEFVPWFVPQDDKALWTTDVGINAILANPHADRPPNPNDATQWWKYDPDCAIDAYYHPADLARRFGANPNQWANWAMGMCGVRVGPQQVHVAPQVTLDQVCLDYFRARGVLQRVQARTRFVSTGAVAFFAAAATGFWEPGNVAIAQLKVKLGAVFHVLRDRVQIIEDANVATVFADTTPVQVPMPTPPSPPVAPAPLALTPEEELAQLDARRETLIREIKAKQELETARANFIAATIKQIRLAEFDKIEIDKIDDGTGAPAFAVRAFSIRLGDGRVFDMVAAARDESISPQEFNANPIVNTFS